MADGPIIERINELAHEEEELWASCQRRRWPRDHGPGTARSHRGRAGSVLRPAAPAPGPPRIRTRSRRCRVTSGGGRREVSPATTEDRADIDPSLPPSGPGSSNASRPMAGGSIRGAAPPVGISAVAIRPFAHTKAHTVETGHTIVASFEPNEQWFYDYDTDSTSPGRRDAAGHHRLDQPTPGPAGRVPRDWMSTCTDGAGPSRSLPSRHGNLRRADTWTGLVRGAGEGTPLTLIHGGAVDSRFFDKNVGPLAEHFRIIAIDLWGHGWSPDREWPVHVESFSTDLAEVIERAGGAAQGGRTASAPPSRSTCPCAGPDLVLKLVQVRRVRRQGGSPAPAGHRPDGRPDGGLPRPRPTARSRPTERAISRRWPPSDFELTSREPSTRCRASARSVSARWS